MAYWLVKSEPSTYSIDNLKSDKFTCWDGVRNYQARNYLRQMKTGEQVFFYHSSSDPMGIVGLAEVKKEAYPEPSQYNPKSKYFDEKSSTENPRWFCPDLKFAKKFSQVITLKELKSLPALKDMILIKQGTRLSVQPVSEKEFKAIMQLSENVSPR